MKFSIVLIARNESKTLPRLIFSLKEFQQQEGEIILLDTGSTDNTAEIARSLGCIVHEVGDKFRIIIDKKTADQINQKYIIDGEEPIIKEEDSLFDYSSARNYAASLASNDMIAMPDCDEIYTKLDLDKINKIIESGIQQLEYQFVFAHDNTGKPLIQFLHCKFYNRIVMKWTGTIHEVLSGNANRQYLDESIIKLEHYQNVETNRNGYLVGLALDCFNDPHNDRNAHYFARELMYKNRFKSAIEQFKIHIAMDKWPEERSQSAMHIGECYMYLGNPDESFKWYFKSVDICPNRREPFMKIAEHYFKLNAPKHTILYAEAALLITETSFYSNYQPYYTNLPHELLYWAYWWIGNKEKSKEHYNIAYSMQPTNPKYMEDRKFYYTTTSLIDTLIDKLDLEIPFSFVKRGDGELACMRGDIGNNCDGHPYTNELGIKLKESFEFLNDKAIIVDFNNQIDYNILLHRTDTNPSKFWKTVKKSNKKKLFIGPIKLKIISDLLKSEYFEIPEKNAFSIYNEILDFLKKSNAEILVFSAGMTTKVLIAELLKNKPTLTCIDAGSSFDPIVNTTRTYQISKEKFLGLYKELPKISIIIPTLEREAGLQRCLDSIYNLDYPKDKLTTSVIEGDESVPFKVAKGLKDATGEWILYAANDTEFEKDTLTNAIKEIESKNLKFLAFNTNTILPDKGNICEHFMIHKDIIPLLDKGEIFSTDFHHVGVDNYLWAQLKKLGLAYRSEKAVLKHYHFSTHNTMDKVYEKGWYKHMEDRAKLKMKLELLNY